MLHGALILECDLPHTLADRPSVLGQHPRCKAGYGAGRTTMAGRLGKAIVPKLMRMNQKPTG
jgi:hypothetical protein